MQLLETLRRVAAASLCSMALACHAAEQAAPSIPASAAASIPFKQEQQGLAEQSLSTLFITLALLGITIVALYYLRNYLIKKTGNPFLKPSSIQLKERARLSPQLTMYVVTYRDKEILLAQTANAVAAVAEYPFASSAANAGELPQGHPS